MLNHSDTTPAAMNCTAKDSFGTSCSLLERVKANLPEAWRQLTVLYCPLVYHWYRRSGLRGEDAADGRAAPRTARGQPASQRLAG
jgi:hypothetical protein